MCRKLLFILISFSLFMAVSCGPAKKEQQSKIESLEKALMNTKQGSVDTAKALELIEAYQSFAEDYPQDSLAGEYLFKMAEIQLHAVSPQEAIMTLDRVMKEYPSYRKIPECLFLKGFIYENNLHDLEKAKAAYQQFVTLYPQHYFADDARVLIQNLGKSPEELIREFEAKNQGK
jgi:TolA-binding protein